jgi:hypothetical protein
LVVESWSEQGRFLLDVVKMRFNHIICEL